MTHALLIDTETLQQNLGQPGLVILDVRGRAAYEFGGHIPGAVHSTWHEYSDPHAVPKGLLDPDRGRMEQKIRALGITVPCSNGRFSCTHLTHPPSRIRRRVWPRYSNIQNMRPSSPQLSNGFE